MGRQLTSLTSISIKLWMYVLIFRLVNLKSNVKFFSFPSSGSLIVVVALFIPMIKPASRRRSRPLNGLTLTATLTLSPSSAISSGFSKKIVFKDGGFRISLS